jgi:hypothetical protein
VVANDFVVGLDEGNEPVIGHIGQGVVPKAPLVVEGQLATLGRICLEQPIQSSLLTGCSEQGEKSMCNGAKQQQAITARRIADVRGFEAHAEMHVLGVSKGFFDGEAFAVQCDPANFRPLLPAELTSCALEKPGSEGSTCFNRAVSVLLEKERKEIERSFWHAHQVLRVKHGTNDLARRIVCFVNAVGALTSPSVYAKWVHDTDVSTRRGMLEQIIRDFVAIQPETGQSQSVQKLPPGLFLAAERLLASLDEAVSFVAVPESVATQARPVWSIFMYPRRLAGLAFLPTRISSTLVSEYLRLCD